MYRHTDVLMHKINISLYRKEHSLFLNFKISYKYHILNPEYIGTKNSPA